MMFKRIITFLLCLLLLPGCENSMNTGQLKKAGLLVPETINDQVWGTKGYKGLLKVQSKFDVEVYYKEGMNSKAVVERAVKELDQKGVNLIFGHGNEFGGFFDEISKSYPDIHFVSFNSEANSPQTTSLNFDAYAMGFFGGMVAAHSTKTNQLGVIAAYDWQPEVRGFQDGAKFQNGMSEVSIKYVGSWDDKEKAMHMLKELIKNDVDVVYPAGDGFNVPIIESMKERGLFVIGYVSDQSDLGEEAVLTSTVQHVDALYEIVAEKFNNGTLESGNLSFDFEDNVISLGKFSPIVNKEFQKEINGLIQTYIETGKLPEKK